MPSPMNHYIKIQSINTKYSFNDLKLRKTASYNFNFLSHLLAIIIFYSDQSICLEEQNIRPTGQLKMSSLTLYWSET